MLTNGSLSRYLSDALTCLATPFAQLAFLTSVRDHYTGRYMHEGWASFSSPSEVHDLLRNTHLRVFDGVLRLSLVAFCKELRKHFQALEQEERRVVHLWLEIEPYYEMIPQGCSLLSRKMFISQFRLALEILAQAPEWAYLREPIAPLPRQPVPQYLRQTLN